jgi:succinyl-CoA synthetase beta subunit
MQLKEYQGKALLAERRIPIPHGVVVSSPSSVKAALARLSSPDVVVKAQVLSGGRGKEGLVRIVPKGKAPAVTATMLREGSVLIEECLDIAKELYLALAIDGPAKSIALLFAERGGMDIEDIARSSPKSIRRCHLDAFDARKASRLFPKAYRKQATAIARRMHQLMIDKDATLVEINPLALTKRGELVAADAKVIIDESALFRQPELRRLDAQRTPAEREAKEAGMTYVALPGEKGSIAVIGNGAGLVMASLDLVYYYGGHPASFLDLGGGADEQAMEKALAISLGKPGVKGLLVNVFAGITHARGIADAIVRSSARARAKIPLIIRLAGTEQEEARRILERAGMAVSSSMEDGVKAVVRRTR